MGFLTFEDVVRSGACVDGVLDACENAGFYFGSVDEAIVAFPGEESTILKAANLDGNGDGDGDGYGF